MFIARWTIKICYFFILLKTKAKLYILKYEINTYFYKVIKLKIVTEFKYSIVYISLYYFQIKKKIDYINNYN